MLTKHTPSFLIPVRAAALRGAAAALFFSCFAASIHAAPITVPNGNFSDPNNNGYVGGGLVGTNVSNQTIGTGPWAGSTAGILGLVTPPRLTIGSGYGQISGIANTAAAGVADNGAFFSQTLSNNWQANMVYTLTANINTGSVLSLGALASDSVGIGLTNVNGSNTTSVARSTDAQPTVTLSLLSGTEYQLSMIYATGSSAPSGQIGITLFDTPSNLATAQLLSSVRFDTVSLDASSPTPEPATFAITGFALLGASLLRFRKRAKKEAAKA